jgi:hypothetical protein
VAHRSSAQQACPWPPQLVQVFCPVQTFPRSQRSPVARHTFAESIVVSQQPELQLSPAQHGCPSPPQPAHLPDARQKSPLPQVLPVARHMSVVESQHPESHSFPGQHGAPGVPHASHTPRQIVFAAVHCV